MRWCLSQTRERIRFAKAKASARNDVQIEYPSLLTPCSEFVTKTRLLLFFSRTGVYVASPKMGPFLLLTPSRRLARAPPLSPSIAAK
jgi:hypothetical protein